MKNLLTFGAVLLGGITMTGCSSGESDTFDVDTYLKDFNRAVPAEEDDRQVEALRKYFTEIDDPFCIALKSYEEESEDRQIVFMFGALEGYSGIIGADVLGEKTLTYAVETLSGCFD